MKNLPGITKSIFLKTFANILFLLLTLVISVFLNRYYGKDLYGLLVLVYAVTSFCFFFADLGAKQTINRFIPQYLKKQNEPKIGSLINSAVLYQIMGVALFSSCIFFFSDFIAVNFFHHPELAPLIRVGILFFATFALMDFIFQVFQAYQSWLKESILNVLYLILYLGLICTFTIFLNKSIKNVLFANSIACLLIIILGIFLLPKEIRSFLCLNFNFSQVRFLNKKILTFGLPLLFNNLTFFILMWFDKALLGKYGHLRYVTFYYIAFGFYSGIMAMLKTLYTVFMPYIASFSVESQEKIQDNFRLVFKYFLQVAVFISIVSFFAVEPLVKLLYGADYLPVVVAFRLLTVLIILRAITNPIHMFMLNVYGLVKENLIISSILAASTAILDILLIPLYGYKGAIIAATVGYICFIIGALFVRKIRKMIPGVMILNTTICIIALIAAFYLLNLLGIKSPFIFPVILLPFYFVSLIIIKELKSEDLAMIKKIIGVSS